MRGLLLSLLIPAILAQTPSPSEPQPFSYQWTVESGTYVDHVETLPSIGAEGLTITWTPSINGTCNDAVLCVKYLLAPVPNKDTWDTTHCASIIKPLTNTQVIYPRMGLHHFYLYRSTCMGSMMISGKKCTDRIFDGKKCEVPDEKAVKKLNSGINYAPFTISPDPTRQDLGHITFIVNNPEPYAKGASVTINATGPLDLIGRYGAIPRLTPPTFDFNYTSNTVPIFTLSQPYGGLKFAKADNTNTDTGLSYLYYLTLMNHGNNDVIVNNITAIIEKCPDESHAIGDKCVKYNSIIPPISSNLIKPTTDSEWQFFVIQPEKIKNSFTIIIQQGLKDKENPNPKLPDVYIRTRAYPRNEDDNDGSFADNYDLYIPASGKEYIVYESGITDISDTWYLGLRVAGGVVPPVWITSGQECAGDTGTQCSGQGECKDHICQCKSGFIGPSCGTPYSPSDEIELSSATNYTLLMIGLCSPIVMFFILRRHLRKIVNRPSMASQGAGLGMGGPGHVVGGNIQDDDRRWQ